MGTLEICWKRFGFHEEIRSRNNTFLCPMKFLKEAGYRCWMVKIRREKTTKTIQLHFSICLVIPNCDSLVGTFLSTLVQNTVIFHYYIKTQLAINPSFWSVNHHQNLKIVEVLKLSIEYSYRTLTKKFSLTKVQDKNEWLNIFCIIFNRKLFRIWEHWPHYRNFTIGNSCWLNSMFTVN